MAAATAQKKRPIPINGAVLEWARDRIGLTQADAADAAGFDLAQIQDWERGERVPTVKQARKLAHVYDRPFLEFFARERPSVQALELVPDFRMHRDDELPPNKTELLLIQAEAEELRLNAIDLFEMLGDRPPMLPNSFYSNTSSDAEKVAAQTRAFLQIPSSMQTEFKYKERDGFSGILRHKFEQAGILVAKNSGLSRVGARGLCFYATPLPIIVFSNESPAAQAFTLAHELAHVVLRVSAVSGPPGSALPSVKAIEDWCDRFAAAFLIPREVLARFAQALASPLDSIEDIRLTELANRFAVSRHAMLIRLVNLGYVKASFYWNVKRPQFLAEESQFKAKGRPKYYGSRYRSSRGDLYTGLVLDAWSDGVITNHNAAEFMGIKNLSHLEAIRERFRE